MLKAAADQLATIAGQQPSIRRARKSIAAFKLREGMPVGVSVTLRGERGYEFLDRLVTIAIPRIRDFRGLSARSFDGRGNYSIGVKEQIIFPEVDYDAIDQVRGLDITITTSAATDIEAYALLAALGMPFSPQGRPKGYDPAADGRGRAGARGGRGRRRRRERLPRRPPRRRPAAEPKADAEAGEPQAAAEREAAGGRGGAGEPDAAERARGGGRAEQAAAEPEPAAEADAAEPSGDREPAAEAAAAERGRRGAADGRGQRQREHRLMAKTSLRVKQARTPKFKTRAYTRCNRCGRPRAVYRKFGVCRICLRELAHNGQIPGMTKSSW